MYKRSEAIILRLLSLHLLLQLTLGKFRPSKAAVRLHSFYNTVVDKTNFRWTHRKLPLYAKEILV
jgi:hypothetical protein